MFKKILVALDLSSAGKKVFEQGLALAKLDASCLMLLHVLSVQEEGSPFLLVSNFDYYPGINKQTLLYQQQWETYQNEGVKMLQSYCTEATTKGVSTEFTQNFGSPGRTICDLARSWSADLIVIGRRGHSGLTELFLGSVSNYVLHHAPCSVYVVNLSVNAEETEVVKETTDIASVS